MRLPGTCFKGRGVVPGKAEGRALVSRNPFMFAHGVEPRSGAVIDVRSDIRAENIKGKVLIFPFGRGSTTGSAWLLETIRQGNGPAAIVNAETEPIIVTGLTVARLLYGVIIPLVDMIDEEVWRFVSPGSIVRVDGARGKITVA